MSDELKKQLSEEREFFQVDITEPIHNLLAKKFESDLNLLKKCFETTEYYFDKLVRDVETYVDEEKIITH